jgi:hypothetical protein
MLFSTELRGRGARLQQASRKPTPTKSIQHPGPASNVSRHTICAPGDVLDGDRHPPYDQTSPVIGSAVAALFA